MGLFTTHIVRVEDRIVPVVQKIVHEGMSADRATQVLSDFESKAQDNIVQAFRTQTGNNRMDGSVIVFRDQLTFSLCVVAAFTMNGKEFKLKEKIDKLLSPQEAIKFLVKAFSEKIAVDLLRDNSSELKQLFGGR